MMERRKLAFFTLVFTEAELVVTTFHACRNSSLAFLIHGQVSRLIAGGSGY